MCLCNTQPFSSRCEIDFYPDYHFSGGHDWLEWGVCVQWDENTFHTLIEKLEVAKEYCQKNKQAKQEIHIGGIPGLMVGRTGINRGGDRGEHYEYKITWGRMTLGIACRNNLDDKRANIFVRLSGRECLLLGSMKGYQLARELIAGLGGRIIEEKLSRVDLNLDIAGLNTRELQEAVERKQFITDAGNVLPIWEVLHERKTGFIAGKRPMRLTVYDKLEERLGKCDSLYFRGLIDRRWGGEIPLAATRIEYQCSREWLLKQGINSPEDLFRLQGSLVEKLTYHWFRVTDRPVDRQNKNQSRAKTSVLWQAVQSAFSHIYGQPAGPLIPIQRNKIEPIRLIKQARGCLRNALLQKQQECRNYSESSSSDKQQSSYKKSVRWQKIP